MTLCMDALDVRLAPTPPPAWLHASAVTVGMVVKAPEWPTPRRVRGVTRALDGTLDFTCDGGVRNLHGGRRVRVVG